MTSSKTASDDLFGGLSDSDCSDNEKDLDDDERAAAAILLDLAMSSEDEQLDHEYSQPMELSLSQDSAENEEHQDNRIELNRSEEGYSSSIPTVSTTSSRSSYDVTASIPHESNPNKPESPENRYDTLDLTDLIPIQNEQMEMETNIVLPLDFLPSGPNLAIQNTNILPPPAISKPPSRSNQMKTQMKNKSSFVEESQQKIRADNLREEGFMSDQILIANFSVEQLDRYSAFRRSKFTRQVVKNVIAEVTGKVPTDPIAVAVAGLAKMFIGEIVEEALELRDALHEQNKPVQPHHIKSAFINLKNDGKLWPPYGQKY